MSHRCHLTVAQVHGLIGRQKVFTTNRWLQLLMFAFGVLNLSVSLGKHSNMGEGVLQNLPRVFDKA